MPSRECRHIHHEMEMQRNVWKGSQFKRVIPGQVFCRDCKQWLYEQPINWDLVPKNATERREARLDDSGPGRRITEPADECGPRGQLDAG